MDDIINISKPKQLNFVKILFEKVFPILLTLIFIVRLNVHNLDSENIRSLSLVDAYGLTKIDMSYGVGLFTLLSLWFEILLVITLCLNAMYRFKSTDNLISFLGPVIIAFNFINLNNITYLYRYNTSEGLFKIFYIIELLLSTIIVFYTIVDKIMSKSKVSIKDIGIMFGIFFLMLIPTLPTFALEFLFGLLKVNALVKDFTFVHRVFIYMAIIPPVVIYFLIRNKSYEVKRYILTYISVGVLVGFSINYNYKSITEPWGLPFHLCNTALYILPICLIFKTKRLFYFTYFINVIGAILAMLMPNYSDTANIISTEMIRFWYNHWIAVWMPLLIVAIHVFERPKLKQFAYSMIAFFVYFMLALFLNVVFSAQGRDVNYFFLNGDFIPDKFGRVGEKIFSFALNFNVGGLTLVFHPVYQIIFFLVYVALGFGELFVYNEFFKIADEHYALHQKLKFIKENKWRFESLLTDEERERIKTDNMETKLVLKNVSKKYGTNKNYSVMDASLEVNGGEIFGFLGPNGAGKSTIIKAIVGIHPITSGEITVCGYDVINQPVLAKYHIGYVPDHYALYEKLTGREYINYIADIFEVTKEDRDARIEKYIHLFELENAIDNKIATYSHGMKQKITIMAALVHNPKVWILDEPLTGLDPNSIYQVKQCMKIHASEGNIVFFSSHLIDIVEKLCQRIAIIKKGHILCCENVEDIEKEMSLEEFYMKEIGSEVSVDNTIEEKTE